MVQRTTDQTMSGPSSTESISNTNALDEVLTSSRALDLQDAQASPKLQTALDQQFQQLLHFLHTDSGIDEQLGSTLKNFYRLGKEEVMAEHLTHLVTQKEADIEKLCHSNYQDFVQSVDRLLSVRTDASELKSNIGGFQQEFNTSSQSLIEKKKELVEYRKILLNIEQAIATVRTCIHILEMVSKANFQINSKKYYSALKTLDELQHTYLGHVSQYEFAKHLRRSFDRISEECIPLIQKKVKNEVLSQMKDWFVSIRESSRNVGELAMEQTSKRALYGSVVPSSRPVSRSSSHRGARANFRGLSPTTPLQEEIMEALLPEEYEFDLTSHDRVQIDFRPLYQGLHIHDVLGIRRFFRNHYDENRRLQANLVLGYSFSLKEDDLSGFTNYLNDIVGFFIIESHVVDTTVGFRSRSTVETLWDMASAKLYEVISNSLTNCRNPDHYLKIKEHMITFIQTMERFSFPVTKLIELLMTFFESYSALMCDRASTKCKETIMKDEGNPVTVHNMAEYNIMQHIYEFKEVEAVPDGKGITRLRFPKTFPFSSSFVDCCEEVRKFIAGFYQFGEGFHQQFGEMDLILKKSVEVLVSKQICKTMEEKLLTQNIQLSEIVRIILNIENFESAVIQFEKLISEHRASHRVISPRNMELKADMDKQLVSSLSSACWPVFRDCRKRAENRIFEVMNMKIDDFLDCASYEFFNTSKPGSPVKQVQSMNAPAGEASPYLLDLVAFLTTVWTSTLSELPVSIKSFVYYDAIYHISASLLAQMTGPFVKKISPRFIEQILEPDVCYLEVFIKSLGDDNLLDQLAEIKQAILLLRMDTPVEEYLNASIKSKKYSRLPKQTAVILLEKLRESGAFQESSSFFGLVKDAQGLMSSEKKIDKAAKRKNVDMVIRALREESTPKK